ncbi:adhesion G protein-coupled receptor E5 [Poeciliopsis prolifica]|uniref:adhesion G protein-coupled receptor E5 n=1 Tax=Poeciliopsis prolifica TaxID=188132 RepID=UPI00241355B2|nr:adhesion G protein-coupled receptor E5 [Poeciliopsis prolifica]
MGFGKALLILGFVCALQKPVFLQCSNGFQNNDGKCEDINECNEVPEFCGNHAKCINTNGSYYCECSAGFHNKKGIPSFTVQEGQCTDINECLDNNTTCGPHGTCNNVIGHYKCVCNAGYESADASNNTAHCRDIDECEEHEDICGEKGVCENLDGSYRCKCDPGHTNYGQEKTKCSKLECDSFGADSDAGKSFDGLAAMLSMMRNSCLALSNQSFSAGGKADGDALLEKLLTATDTILSPGSVENSKGVTGLLSAVEKSILLIGPQLKANDTKMETKETEAKITVRRGATRPTGQIHLTGEHADLNTDWTTAAGKGPYPGFALAALLSYKNLEGSVNTSFEDLKEKEKDAVSFQVFSKVVSVVVSNPSTQNLHSPVNITFRHLKDIKPTPEVSYICAYWDERGVWSPDGCSQELSNDTHTVCSCKHLSSFAVLMALYPMKTSFQLQLLTQIGLTISLVCLVLSVLTFMFCRSIQGTRTTIHLHLCVCLFMADLVFLVGISRTKPEGGCKFVAAMLHFFFLGVMSWMLLEGVQLYRMVVLVFNATVRPLYLYITGYGVPLGIVVISAIIRPGGYGTEDHCWLSLEHGLIWSFFGPVCFIIAVNVLFFIVTVWKLAQKFATLNPDLSKLHKIKAFTVTAIAQMCILGLMWVFGAFLFSEGMTAVAYIFTVLNSLQGALVFIMHCLLSKQVRDEYAQFLSCVCTPQKKRYSDFSSTNPSSSQSQGSRSGQITGESQI